MSLVVNKIRKAVKREKADKNLRIMLISFAGSVIATRFYLQATDYPQLSTSSLHISHLLFGGLFLFTASLLPLIFTNRWVYSLSAFFSGIGVGLFIDEVGKFITQNNDYFYPPAATIIYSFFLLTVLFYLRIKKDRNRDARTELYRSLDSLQEVLDFDLERQEKKEIVERLIWIKNNSDNPEYQSLADSIQHFLSSNSVFIVDDKNSAIDRLSSTFNHWEKRFTNKKILNWAVIIGLTVVGTQKIGDFVFLIRGIFSPQYIDYLIDVFVNQGRIVTDRNLSFFLVRLGMEALIGVFLISGAYLMLLGKKVQGVNLSYYSLLVSLAAVNIFVFYFDQFRAISYTLIDFLLLISLQRYKNLYHA